MGKELVSVYRNFRDDNESLVRKFIKKVNTDGLLKEHKLNNLSREERKKFKKFENRRRSIKVSSRR